ncbi:hypothetical protein ABIA32_006068 [Streptacidiphilus sp. MAP12-20]
MAETSPGASPAQLLTLDEVEAIARAAHAGQLDKAGRPYAVHLAAVAEGTARLGGDEAQVAAGWLHDAVEDDALSVEWLDAAALPQRTKDIVLALTKRADEPLADYAARVLATPGAVTVKDADLASNSAPDRLALLPDAALRARLTAKYELTSRLIHPEQRFRPPTGSGAEGDPTDEALLAGLDRESAGALGAWARLGDFAGGWSVQPGDAEWQGPHPVYGSRVNAVTAALATVGAVTPAFHWVDYTLPPLTPEGMLTPADAVRTATALVRGERFTDGVISGAWKDGRLFATVRALSAWQPR